MTDESSRKQKKERTEDSGLQFADKLPYVCLIVLDVGI